jgi:hypothetical protein
MPGAFRTRGIPLIDPAIAGLQNLFVMASGSNTRLCENSKVRSKRGSKIIADLEKMQYRPNVKVIF